MQEEMLLVTSRSQIQARQFSYLNKINWYARQLLMVKEIIITYSSKSKKDFFKQSWREIKTFLPIDRNLDK